MKRALLAVVIAAVASTACRGRRAAETEFRGAPVILISIDTLRADHLPAYGYRGVETPAIDALRRDGVLFTRAYSHVPLTLPSHASILTGLLPPKNHVRDNIGYRVDPRLPTIASMLHASGYTSGAAISAYVLRGSAGLKESFDFYDDAIQNKPGTPVGALQRAGTATAAIAKSWIAQHDSAPFFFFLHLYEPHSPYSPPEPFYSRYASKYDGEIAAADSVVGDLIAFLKTKGIYDKAVIVLLSDHGEGLYDHGDPEHGIFLYREEIHVPLIVKLPRGARAGETIDAPAGLVDVMPTIAQLTGTTPPAGIDGISLFAPRDANRRIYGETLYPRIHLGWSDLYSLTDHQYQYIRAPKPELYDVDRDPKEKTNILADQRRVYASMKEELDRSVSAVEMPSHVDPEEAKKLTALGYLGSTAAAPAGPLPDPKDRIGEVAALMKGGTLARDGHDAEAIEIFRKVVAENPRLSDGWNQLAQALERQGRFEEAASAYRKTIELSPELAPEFGLSLGAVLMKLGRFDDAVKHARLGEKVNPGGAHMLLARIAEARKDYRTAESEARAAQNDAYSGVAASVLLAKILAEEERAAEALALIESTAERAAKSEAGPIESLDYVRGDALARLQRYSEAVNAFRAEIAAFPHDLEAYSHLAIVYELLRQPESARAAMDGMVRANPGPRARELAAKTLDSLGDRAAAARFR